MRYPGIGVRTRCDRTPDFAGMTWDCGWVVCSAYTNLVDPRAGGDPSFQYPSQTVYERIPPASGMRRRGVGLLGGVIQRAKRLARRPNSTFTVSPPQTADEVSAHSGSPPGSGSRVSGCGRRRQSGSCSGFGRRDRAASLNYSRSLRVATRASSACTWISEHGADLARRRCVVENTPDCRCGNTCGADVLRTSFSIPQLP